MSEAKKYYWIKLRESLITSDAVGYLMSPEFGAEYVILYQMLCLKTANTNGRLERKIGDIVIPYNEEKIQMDCKYFDIEMIKSAIKIYKQLGLLQYDDDGVLVIKNHDELVGSESEWAEKKRIFRDKQRQGNGHSEDMGEDMTEDKKRTLSQIIKKNVDNSSKNVDNCEDIVRQEIELDSIVVNNNTNTQVRTCEAWINHFVERMGTRIISFYRSKFLEMYGETDAVDTVLNALADLHSSVDGIEVSKVHYSHEQIEACLDSITEPILGDLFLSMYELNPKDLDGKKIRKVIAEPTNYVFKILLNKLQARESA